jgi:transposase
MDDFVSIKNIKKKNPGLGTRKIAGLFGISRNTVKKALSSDSTAFDSRRTKINPDIEPFVQYIDIHLFKRHLKGSRILNDIISKGYKGSKSAFYRYIKAESLNQKRTFFRYETAEAEQAQFDWSPYTVLIDGKLVKIFIFTYLLGYSRYRIYNVSLSESASAVYEAIEDSIFELEGAAHRLQTDNAKCFIQNASSNNLQYNSRYLAFCGHFGFEPTRSLPAHPWSKGKVENPNKYLEYHFVQGNSFSSFEDLSQRLKKFQTEVNNRVHSTTKKTPAELFEKEKLLLFEPPKSRYVSVKEEVRKVTADCLFSYGGSKYSVPTIFANREVWIKVSKGYMIKVYSSSNHLITEHKLSVEKGKTILDYSHYANHWLERGNWNKQVTIFLEKFEGYQWFIDNLKAQKRINHNYHLTQIVFLSSYYPKQNMLKTFEACQEYNVYTYSFIKGYVEKYASASSLINEISPKEMVCNYVSKLPADALNRQNQIKRSLTEYKINFENTKKT